MPKRKIEEWMREAARAYLGQPVGPDGHVDNDVNELEVFKLAQKIADAYANRPVSAVSPQRPTSSCNSCGDLIVWVAEDEEWQHVRPGNHGHQIENPPFAGVSAETEETVRAEFECYCRERWDLLPASANHILRRFPGGGEYEVFNVQMQFAAFQAGRNSVSASSVPESEGWNDALEAVSNAKFTREEFPKPFGLPQEIKDQIRALKRPVPPATEGK